jgi:uncharacterized protein YdcH (DUF465 family)
MRAPLGFARQNAEILNYPCAFDPCQSAAPMPGIGLIHREQIKEHPMSHTPHELAEEFPAEVEKMHKLKLENAHFARLFDEYHEVNRAVHRAETLLEPTDTANETEMRRTRARLKDEIWALLSAA